MAGGIVGALDRAENPALGDFWSKTIKPAVAVVAAPFTGGASLALLTKRGKTYVNTKIYTPGVARIAIPIAATVGAVALTVATAGVASPLIPLALSTGAGLVTKGVAVNAQNQAASAAANQQAQVTAQQQQAAQVYATAHPVLAQLESWWAEYPTAIMAGAGILAVAAIIRAAKS